MAVIPIFRSEHLFPFAQFCKQHGLSTKTAFKRHKLPSIICYEDGIYIPLVSACHALGDIARAEGVTDFGARSVINYQMADYGEQLHQIVVTAPSLHIALHRIKLALINENLIMDLNWQSTGDQCCVKVVNVEHHLDANAWSNLLFLLSIVRCFTHEAWLPSNVIFSSKKPPSSFIHEHLKGIEFRYDPFCVGFSFPTHFLAKAPTARPNNAAGLSPKLENLDTCSDGFNHSIKGLMKAYSYDKSLRMDTFSEALGFSARTLQRKLKQHNLTYAGLMDELRFERSNELLQNNKLKVADIAHELGYSDASHFVRAFKRISSLTPEQYRQAHYREN